MHMPTLKIILSLLVFTELTAIKSEKLQLDDNGVSGDSGIPRLLKLKILNKHNDFGKKLVILHILRKPKDDCDEHSDEDCVVYNKGYKNIFLKTSIGLITLNYLLNH